MAKIKRALVLSGGGGRGAYQIGVYRRLVEAGWQPDLVCGTSVGAINACAIGSGMPPEKITDFWLNIADDRIYRYRLWQKILNWISRRGYSPVLNTEPLYSFLDENLDFEALHNSEVRVIISAIEVYTSRLKYFHNRQINIEHVMASSAIPVLFPWQEIDGVPHWDGGVMANTPVYPALELEAEEIVVVLLSPVGARTGCDDKEQRRLLPRNRMQAVELLLEQSLISSFQNLVAGLDGPQIDYEQPRNLIANIEAAVAGMVNSIITSGKSRIYTIHPDHMLGLGSIMNFKRDQSEMLLELGYEDAGRCLTRSGFFR